MYKCEDCGSQLTIKIEPIYHYTESGLENVYLENQEVEFCKKCKAGAPRFRRINQLHETIGRALAQQPAPLVGAQLRYLRKHLAYSTREWAALLRVDAATVNAWESGETALGPQIDLLIRLVWFHLLAERTGAKLPDRLVEQLATVRDEPDELPLIVINADNPAGYAYRRQLPTPRRSRRVA
jgi:DNA-binding transcriptional regulator YiaG